jgi:hypothetical protein
VNAPIEVVSDGEGTRLSIPMPRPYLPVPSYLGTTLFGLVLIPAWMLAFSLICWLGRIKPPPRAVFIVDAEQFKIEFVAHNDGTRTSFQCNRKDLVELRKNQYSKGLWIHVRGKVKTTFLPDIDDDTILKAADVLRSKLGLDTGTPKAMSKD